MTLAEGSFKGKDTAEPLQQCSEPVDKRIYMLQIYPGKVKGIYSHKSSNGSFSNLLLSVEWTPTENRAQQTLRSFKSGVVEAAHIFNPSTGETDAGGSMFKASLVTITSFRTAKATQRPCLKNKKRLQSLKLNFLKKIIKK